MANSVLLLGIPRSGTTWMCEVLGMRREYQVVLEPDNEKTSWLACRLKRGLPRFPTLAADDEEPSFALLWHYAFVGRLARGWARGMGSWPVRLRSRWAEREVARKEELASQSPTPPVGRHAVPLLDRLLFPIRSPANASRIVKSVHAPLCAEWVVRQTAPAHVVVMLRHPFATIASIRRMVMEDGFRPRSLRPHLSEPDRSFLADGVAAATPATRLRSIALQVLTLQGRLSEAAARHPNWVIVQFEDLCQAPTEKFRHLFDRLGYDWDARIEAGIAKLNRPGTGYRPQRIAGQQIDRWKKDFTPGEMTMLEEMLGNRLQAILSAEASAGQTVT